MAPRNDDSERLGIFDDLATTGRGSPSSVWPRLVRPKPWTFRSGAGKRGKRRPSVLIVGDLSLELPFNPAASGADLASCPCLLQQTPASCDPRCAACPVCQLRVGGFIGHTVKALSTLGARISICANLPIPVPRPIEEFIERWHVDTQFTTRLPAGLSVVGASRCADGRTVFGRQGASTVIPVDLPRAATCECDLILVDPSCYAQRRGLIRGVERCLEGLPSSALIGLRIDHRSTKKELDLTTDNRVWTFLRHCDAQRLSGLGVLRPGEVLRRLRRLCASSRLVLQLGAKGALLCNKARHVCQVRALKVFPTRCIAPRDTLLAVTVLSSRMGANEKTSLRRGVCAATKLARGEDLPKTLEALDIP